MSVGLVRIGGEYAQASGDGDRTNATVSTFNNLFHTNLHYGQADMVSWRNMVGLAWNFKYKQIKWGLGYSRVTAGAAVRAVKDDYFTEEARRNRKFDPRADKAYFMMTYKF